MPQTSLHIGFIGPGLMSRPIAASLPAAGPRVFIYSRSRPVVGELSAGVESLRIFRRRSPGAPSSSF